MNEWTSIETVDRIATFPEPVLRNLRITQCYHELSLAFTRRTGQCANWCTYATWASKQAGQTIRREDLERAVKHALTAALKAGTNERSLNAPAAEPPTARTPSLRQRLGEALDPRRIVERSSDAVARGNQKVFAEIGREFARFEATCLQDEGYDAESLARFCDGLRPGDPPGGQRYLRQAFARYYQAFFETDPKARAELMLLANIEIGLHEQTRLQPEITEALDASLADPEDDLRRLLGALFPKSAYLLYALIRFLRLAGRPLRLDVKLRRLLALARRRVRMVLTHHLMMLALPGIRLRLGQDLRAQYPPSLRQVTSADLLALLAQVDPTSDSLRDSGATDWAELQDRLHFIVDLFRCYHETPDLLRPPFTAEQVAAMLAGRVPEGEL